MTAVRPSGSSLGDYILQESVGWLGITCWEPRGRRRRLRRMRVAAIEREYHAKLGDLPHNYALRVRGERVLALE